MYFCKQVRKHSVKLKLTLSQILDPRSLHWKSYISLLLCAGEKSQTVKYGEVPHFTLLFSLSLPAIHDNKAYVDHLNDQRKEQTFSKPTVQKVPLLYLIIASTILEQFHRKSKNKKSPAHKYDFVLSNR